MFRVSEHFIRWRYDSRALWGVVLTVAGLTFGVVTLLVPDEGTPPAWMGVVALLIAAVGLLLCVHRWRRLERAPDTWVGRNR